MFEQIVVPIAARDMDISLLEQAVAVGGADHVEFERQVPPWRIESASEQPVSSLTATIVPIKATRTVSPTIQGAATGLKSSGSDSG